MLPGEQRNDEQAVKTVAMTLTIHESVHAALTVLAHEQGVSKTEMLRRCISLAHGLEPHRQMGRTLAVQDDDSVWTMTLPWWPRPDHQAGRWWRR